MCQKGQAKSAHNEGLRVVCAVYSGGWAAACLAQRKKSAITVAEVDFGTAGSRLEAGLAFKRSHGDHTPCVNTAPRSCSPVLTPRGVHTVLTPPLRRRSYSVLPPNFDKWSGASTPSGAARRPQVERRVDPKWSGASTPSGAARRPQVESVLTVY